MPPARKCCVSQQISYIATLQKNPGDFPLDEIPFVPVMEACSGVGAILAFATVERGEDVNMVPINP